ncbi:MAG: hypothetical protein KOO62_07000 [candidate division Zixibacteria bacterium]|nr:hypothetical protein [candidate division Zixibacteria bacterium]
MAEQLKQTLESSAIQNENLTAPGYCQKTLNLLSDGVFVFADDFHLMQFNDAACQIMETYCPELVGSPIIDLKLKSIFGPESFFGWADRIMKTRTTGRDCLLENLLAVSSTSRRLYDVHCTISGTNMVICLKDVTQQRRSVQRLSDLAKLSEKGILASWVAHDLNNFLSLILGSSELAELVLKKGNTEKAFTLMDRIKTNVRKIEQFNADLIASTRADAQECPTDLNQLVAEVIAFASGLSLFARVAVTTELDNALPEITMKPDQVAQLLLHFLDNAADAITEADRELGHIEVATGVDEKHITLSVTDNGSGIPPEVIEKLFQRRFSSKGDNRGYSLVTCQSIVHDHGALAEIESEEGQGSKFTVRFPLSTE